MPPLSRHVNPFLQVSNSLEIFWSFAARIHWFEQVGKGIRKGDKIVRIAGIKAYQKYFYSAENLAKCLGQQKDLLVENSC